MDFALAVDCPHACPPMGMRHIIICRIRKLALAVAMSALPGMIEEMRFGIAKEETLLRLGSFHARSRRRARFTEIARILVGAPSRSSRCS